MGKLGRRRVGLFDNNAANRAADLITGLAHGGQAGVDGLPHRQAIKTDNRDILAHFDPGMGQCMDRTNGDRIGDAQDGGGAVGMFEEFGNGVPGGHFIGDAVMKVAIKNIAAMGFCRAHISGPALPCVVQVGIAAEIGDLAMAQTNKMVHSIDKGLFIVDIEPGVIVAVFGAALHNKGDMRFAQIVDARIVAAGSGNDKAAHLARSDQAVHDFDFVMALGDGGNQQVPVRQGQLGRQPIKDFGQKRVNLMPMTGGQDKADGFNHTTRQAPGGGGGAIAQFIGGLAHTRDGFGGNVGIVVQRARNRALGQAKVLCQSGNRHGLATLWRAWHGTSLIFSSSPLWGCLLLFRNRFRKEFETLAKAVSVVKPLILKGLFLRVRNTQNPIHKDGIILGETIREPDVFAHCATEGIGCWCVSRGKGINARLCVKKSVS